MENEILTAYAGIPKSEIDYWNGVLESGNADFSKEKLKPMSCEFVRSVAFKDGFTADIKVCTDTAESGGVWSEMVIYDPSGREVWLSDVSDRLSGTWAAEFDGKRYEVYVDRDWYGKLGTSENEFKRILAHELLTGLPADYVGDIVDVIAEKVAEDVTECADVDAWNSGDISLGAGRVILKALGVEV